MTRRVWKDIAIALVTALLTAGLLIGILLAYVKVWGVMALLDLLSR